MSQPHAFDMDVKVHEALVAAQREIKNPTKNASNPHFKNRYANLENVIESCKDVLLKHGFAVTQDCNTCEVPGYIRVVTRLLHTSGGFLTFSCVVPLEKMSPQAGMSAFTYGRRYGLLAALCLAAEDDDGNEATFPDKKTEAAAKPTVIGLQKGVLK